MPPVVYTRVDQKLVHAQVLLSWIGPLKIRNIIIVDNSIYNDQKIKKFISVSVPLEYNITFMQSDNFLSTITFRDNESYMVLFQNIKEAYQALCPELNDNLVANEALTRNRSIITTLNLACYAQYPGTISLQIHDAFYIAEDELGFLTNIASQQISLYYQVLHGHKQQLINIYTYHWPVN
jgi:mannose/fructose/N-acetylgalactosamine-specific phosphotransferase system component IIB